MLQRANKSDTKTGKRESVISGWISRIVARQFFDHKLVHRPEQQQLIGVITDRRVEAACVRLTDEFLHRIERHGANLCAGVLCRELKGFKVPIGVVVVPASERSAFERRGERVRDRMPLTMC
jgi:hypothetical protein